MIKNCVKLYVRSGKNLFWSFKNSDEVLDKLKAKNFNATSLPTHAFSNLYTTLPHNLIKDKLMVLLKEPSKEKTLLTLYVTTETRFSLGKAEKYHAWSCQNVCDALTFDIV